jgi:hypothetical protein
MTVYAIHTPQVASPINDQRAGTYRVGSDNPDPIQITKGWDAVLYFAFRNHMQRVYHTTGRTITGRIFNTENTEIWNGIILADPLIAGAASLTISRNATTSFPAGLYSLVVEYVDDHNRTMIASTTRSLPRFIVEVIDITTVSLNI